MTITRQYSVHGITSKSSQLTSMNFSISTQQNINIITPGATSIVVEQDVNKLQTDNATFDYYYQIWVSNIVGDSIVTYESLDPNIATVSSQGITSRVSDGIAKILAKSSNLIRRVDLDHTRQIGEVSYTFDSWVTNSMAKACFDGIDNKIAGKDAVISKPVFVTQSHETPTSYVRNTNCWCNDVDLTCISPWNSGHGIYRAGVLVTPRHILFAKHYQLSVGDTVRFVAMDNTVVDKTLIAKQNIAVGDQGDQYCYDITVGLLDSDVPSSISFVKILDTPVSSFLPNINNNNIPNLPSVPVMVTDYQEHACVTELYKLPDTEAMLETQKPLEDTDRYAFYEDSIVGDSGDPMFLIVDDELILIGTLTYGNVWGHGIDSTPNIAYLKDRINAVMTSLGGGYQLTVKDLSGYPTY